MTPLKRAMIGGRVVLDATGTGDMVYGTIFDQTERGKLCIRPVDGSEDLQADKSVLFKPTDAEWKAALVAVAKDAEIDATAESLQRDITEMRGQLSQESLDELDAQLAQAADIEQADIEVPAMLAEGKQPAAPARTLTDIEEEVGRRNGAVHPDYLQRYRKGKSAKGNTGFNCGDQVAAELEGKDLEQCFEYVQRVTGTDYSDRWSNLNPGMRRMNLGNTLRRFYKSQE